jgi:hypothetical protein
MDFQPISLDAAAAVVAAVRPFAKKVWNADLILVPTMSALPQDVQNAIANDYGNNADVKGVVHNGFVYLMANQHDSTQDVESTILHEAIGHIGVRRLFGAEIDQAGIPAIPCLALWCGQVAGYTGGYTIRLCNKRDV